MLKKTIQAHKAAHTPLHLHASRTRNVSVGLVNSPQAGQASDLTKGEGKSLCGIEDASDN